MDKANKAIPEPTMRRLPSYHRYLLELERTGAQFVSCSSIGRDLRLDPTQVRKDLECTPIVGRPKIGFALRELIQAIEGTLGWNNTKDAFLVGAGHLGAALLGYEKFRQFGLDIVAAFDVDPRKIGLEIHGKQILPLPKLPNLAKRMAIHIGVITVPAEAAQAVADLMVKGGIQAIWNFAPVNLRLPDHVLVHNEDLYSSLAALSCKLEAHLRKQGHAGEK